MRLAWVLLLVACGSGSKVEESGSGSGSGAGSGAGSGKPVAVVDAAPAGPKLDEVMAWMAKDPGAAWQGAWMTKLALRDAGMASYTGSYAALEITGDKAHAWVPGTGKDYELGVKFVAPCKITFTQQDGSGGTNYYDLTYVVDGADVLASNGKAGYRKGKAAIVCSGDDVYVLDDKGTCHKWTERFGKWEMADAKCAWRDEPTIWASFDKSFGKETLALDDGGVGNELGVRGDVVMNQGFHGVLPDPGHGQPLPEHRKLADFAAAKAAAEQRWKETDIRERLKTAGARPGETKTILDLWLAFKQDKAAIKGKHAALSGKVTEAIRKDEVDGKPEWVVLVADPREGKDAHFAVRCRSPRAVKRAVGATVRISGTVAEWWDDPALTECVVK